MVRKLAVAAAAVVALGAGGALANQELLRLQRDPNQWVMPNGNYANHRYSELNQINRDTVRNLRPVWQFSTGVLRGHEGGPLVIGDVMYVHTPFPNRV
ncbi:MAG: PQQ-dependent dehydrogenase, methanol/ethanol family, partial [Acetobacteraceae bacterium]|nr:PQQ-dependent dehydrogenase, methanol/ethanol family [Acetobacteraceae bacterium]